MGTQVKTTIDIADGLLEAAKARAEEEGTTLRALVELGLRAVLAEEQPEKPWRWKPVTGKLRPKPGVDLRNWDQIRDIIYDDVP